jgi:hypothetical protein
MVKNGLSRWIAMLVFQLSVVCLPMSVSMYEPTPAASTSRVN